MTMNPFRLFRRFLALISTALLTIHAADYAVVDLGPGVARGLNDAGVVVGYDDSNGFTFQGGVRTPTPPLAAYLTGLSVPSEFGPWYPLQNLKWTGINSAGKYVGTAVLSNLWQPVPPFVDLRPKPIIWDGSNTPQVPVELLNRLESTLAINSSGVVVGGREGAAFRITSSEFEFLTFPQMYSAFDINDSGAIVGVGRATENSLELAALWTNGVTTLLNLEPFGPFYRYAATAINSAGQIAGNRVFYRPSQSLDYSVGFLWSGEETSYFGTGPTDEVTVNDLNDAGVVVGQWKKSWAMIYRDGTMTDLNTLIPTSGWVLTTAHAINNQGQIVGTGFFNGSQRAFLLNPLNPEEQPPSIITQPQGGQFALGESTVLTVAANGTPTLTYQWQLNQTNLVGETAATLSLTSLDAADTGAYRVLVRNAFGEAFSVEAVVTVLDPEIAVLRYAGITVSGAVGGRYEIQASPSLVLPSWSPLAVLTLTNTSQVWMDMESGTNTGPRFYRSVRLLP